MEVRKAFLIFLGTVFVGLGILGMILPLMPTTVFLLLAAFCYSRSSERFHNWLLTNRLLGKYISNYKSGRGITMRQKISTIVFLWTSIGFSIWMIGARFWIVLLLVVIALAVSIHVFWIKTYRADEIEMDEPVRLDPIVENS